MEHSVKVSQGSLPPPKALNLLGDNGCSSGHRNPDEKQDRCGGGGGVTRVCVSFPAWTPLAWTAFLVPSEHVCLQYGVCGPQTVQNILGENKGVCP